MTAIDSNNKKKFGMYYERLSDRPRLMKHVLVCHASHVPVDNQFKTRKAKPKILVCEKESHDKAAVNVTIHSSETQSRMLEKMFMEKFEEIKDEPYEITFPVLRASQPGGRVFKTHQLGVAARSCVFMSRDTFNLKDPNSPAPAYNCYYDKHLQHFFMRPHLVKKLVSHGNFAQVLEHLKC